MGRPLRDPRIQTSQACDVRSPEQAAAAAAPYRARLEASRAELDVDAPGAAARRIARDIVATGLHYDGEGRQVDGRLVEWACASARLDPLTPGVAARVRAEIEATIARCQPCRLGRHRSACEGPLACPWRRVRLALEAHEALQGYTSETAAQRRAASAAARGVPHDAGDAEH